MTKHDIIASNPYKFLNNFLDGINEIDWYDYDGDETYYIYTKEYLDYNDLGKRFQNHITRKASDSWTVSKENEYPETYTVCYNKDNELSRYVLFHFYENDLDDNDSTIIIAVNEVF